MSEDNVNQLVTRPVTAIVIASEADEGRESANLIVLRKARKEYEAKFKKLREPFEEGLDKLKVEFARVIDPIKLAETSTYDAILAWKRAEGVRIAAEQAERDRQQAEQNRLQRQAEAEARRASMPPPPPLPPIAPAREQARGWETNRGTVNTRKVPKFRVTDESAIPLEMEIDGVMVRLWNVDEVAVGKVRRSYGDKPSPIPGIEFYYDEGLSVK